jgi:hypothetical protein
VVPEVEEVEWRHRLQDRHLLDQQLLDLHDPAQQRNRGAHVGLIYHSLAEDPPHLVELPEDLLEPKLVGLMDDDEEHLVVDRVPRLCALQVLGVEELVQPEITPVVEVGVHLYLLCQAATGWAA